MNKEVRMLCLSDIHIGESKTTAEHTFKSVCGMLTPEVSDVTHLVVSGDFTHRQLTASSEEYQYAVKTFQYLLRFCQDNNIKLRFLEGTPSHDFKQVETLSLMCDAYDVDFKYFSSIEIEYDAEYDMTILYVPDEMGDTAIDVVSEIHRKMELKCLDTVTCAVMHGSFLYHMPGKTSYQIEDFQFVEWFIVIGHNHTKSIVGNICTPGSLERNFFGEEGNKGGYIITISPLLDKALFYFIENTNSHRLDTLDFTESDTESAVKRLTQFLKDYPSKYLRIDVTGNEQIETSILQQITKEYEVKLEIKKKKQEEKHTLTLDVTFEDLQINTENITELILKEIGRDTQEYRDAIEHIK